MNKIKTDTKVFVAADKPTTFTSWTRAVQQTNRTKYKQSLQESTTEHTQTDHNSRQRYRAQIRDQWQNRHNRWKLSIYYDHKPNFNDKPTCRLINPSKSGIGKISKQILERINANIIQPSRFNQWKNTGEVIDWFNKVHNKHHHSFIAFDICEFCPSITANS